MGTITLSKQNRLFWLGRYSERVYTTVQYMLDLYDKLIENDKIDYAGFCQKLVIPCDYKDSSDFIRRYLFDPEAPGSIASGVDAMLGNGMVLRESITTPTLAYLQMAYNALQLAAKSDAPMVELQWVLDDIMAFRGSFDDAIDIESMRNITKAGGSVEKVSLTLRLNWRTERLQKEIQKLVNRLYKTDLPINDSALDIITRKAIEGEDIDKHILLQSVEELFRV